MVRNGLAIFEVDVNDDILKTKTLTGLAIALFNLGNSQKATECIGKAKKNSIAEPSTGKCFSSQCESKKRIDRLILCRCDIEIFKD